MNIIRNMTDSVNDWTTGAAISNGHNYILTKKYTLNSNAYEEYTDITTCASSSTIYYNSDYFGKIFWSKNNYNWNNDWIPVVVPPGERLREILRSRSAPVIISRRRGALATSDVREMRARETLQRLVGEDVFKKFLKDGFITVVSKKGLTYCIHPGSKFTEVYDRGVMVERLCVVLKGDFPPTDSLIMRFLLIMNDEEQFSEYAIKHGVYKNDRPNIKIPDNRDLTFLWKELKLAA